MKNTGKVLSVLLIANAAMMLSGYLLRGYPYHTTRLPLMLGLPASLLGVAFLRPSAALLVLSLVIFPFFSIIVRAHILPLWPLLRLLPKEASLPGLFVGNIAAVTLSLLAWIGCRKQAHHNLPEDTARKLAAPQE